MLLNNEMREEYSKKSQLGAADFNIEAVMSQIYNIL
jgi:hypothetical protein